MYFYFRNNQMNFIKNNRKIETMYIYIKNRQKTVKKGIKLEKYLKKDSS